MDISLGIQFAKPQHPTDIQLELSKWLTHSCNFNKLYGICLGLVWLKNWYWLRIAIHGVTRSACHCLTFLVYMFYTQDQSMQKVLCVILQTKSLVTPIPFYMHIVFQKQTAMAASACRKRQFHHDFLGIAKERQRIGAIVAVLLSQQEFHSILKYSATACTVAKRCV